MDDPQDRSPLRKVEDAVDRRLAPPHPRKYATTDRPATAEDLRRETEAESDHILPAMGTGVMTQAQSHGFLLGFFVGGGLGAVLGAPFGFIGWGGADVTTPMRVLVLAIIGALAGGTIGVLYLMGRMPELEGETMGADNVPNAGTTLRDPETDEHGRAHAGPRTGPR